MRDSLLADVHRARARTVDFVVRTPLLRFRETNVYLKPECLQRMRSYKIRGVANLVLSRREEVIAGGLVTPSAGNMAQAVALMARELGASARALIPESAPNVKKDAIRALGAAVETLPFAELWKIVREGRSEAHPAGVLVHPVFSPELLIGYGAIAVELIEDRPDLEAVVIPFGVGGLTLGIARAIKALRPDCQIYAAEIETATPLARALAAGRSVRVERAPSFVDAIGTPEVLPPVLAELQGLLSGALVVRLEEARAALRETFLAHGLVIEGAAAAALAAALKLAGEKGKSSVACILSGGNIDPKVLMDIVSPCWARKL